MTNYYATLYGRKNGWKTYERKSLQMCENDGYEVLKGQQKIEVRREKALERNCENHSRQLKKR